MDIFLSTVLEINRKIGKLKEYLQKLEYISNIKYNSVMDEDKEEKLDRKIEAINVVFKELSKEVKGDLQNIGEGTIAEEHSETPNGFYIEIRINHWKVLTKKLSDVINEYRTIHVEYNREEQEKMKKQFLIAPPEATDEELADILNTDKCDDVIKSVFVVGSHSSKNILEKATKRNQSIKKIVKTIQDLCDMMNELKEMVHEHGEVIEKIDVNVEKSKERTKKAKKDLTEALGFQIAATRMKRILVIVGGIILIVVVIIIIVVIASKVAK
ncbi:T-SNARE complex subunit/syntaxin [Spraguea lophii 42_110]|uniref:t-SNARE complex subunit/syntaxin n=1 Tax=Spraguea lophii (strain 42_110) TaxID=1358809 RepID=S7XKF3_SPRLO|nr:T-SNARE complex subunit/syntaxin [Spraguea lophii 42_110]